MNKLFVIAIGGTGMRCLESFVHLCAMGMLDDQTVHILTLDTDASNGNKRRTEDLIRLYNNIKKVGSSEEGGATANTFFSAKLNLYRFYTDYGQESYDSLWKKGAAQESLEENKLLADLFLEPDTVQKFPLAHGYRAQTHLGSMLMYHAFCEAARAVKAGDDTPQSTSARELDKFLEELSRAEAQARVFILGSIFGGTGASSIPILPKAIQKFLEIKSDKKTSIKFSEAQFGATLLTEYFRFNVPDEKQKKEGEGKIIADSNFFALNSQAALQFYQGDPAVRQSYKTLYMIGWPVDMLDFSRGQVALGTITGGEKQKNDCHVAELVCAVAALDFLTSESPRGVAEVEYRYKTVEFDGNSLNIYFRDLVRGTREIDFTHRFSGMLSLAFVILRDNEAANSLSGENGVRSLINRFKANNILDYDQITADQVKDLNDYFRRFAYSVDSNSPEWGWVYQLARSVSGQFLLEKDKLTPDLAAISKIDYGKLLPDKRNHWPRGFMSSDMNKVFAKTFEDEHKSVTQRYSNNKEKLIALAFNTVMTLQQK